MGRGRAEGQFYAGHRIGEILARPTLWVDGSVMAGQGVVGVGTSDEGRRVMVESSSPLLQRSLQLCRPSLSRSLRFCGPVGRGRGLGPVGAGSALLRTLRHVQANQLGLQIERF